jgi:hypothetical protein
MEKPVPKESLVSWALTPVILATQEIRSIEVQNQLRQIVCETLS